MLRRKGTTTEQRRDPEGTEHEPYPREVRREGPVSAPPRRGDGHAVREEERMAGRVEMVERAPVSLGQYLANWFTLLVGGALVLAEAALGLRLFLKLTSANSANGFVEFIYDLTGGMIRPFTGALSDQTIVKGGIFEPSVVIAMVVFFIGAMLAIWVVRSLATLRSWGGRLIYR